MDRWEGKVAVVTGASSGIGNTIVKDLVKHGMNVVAIARRLESLQKLKDDMKHCKGIIYPLKVDLREESELIEAFNWISTKLGPIHVLINNAALNIMSDTLEARINDWKSMFGVNVFACGSCIREFLKSFKTHDTPDGRIINVSSIVAHRDLGIPGFYIYTATKNALKTLTLGIRRELINTYPKVTISNISPGYVKDTELFKQHEEYDAERAATRDQVFEAVLSQDISNSVLYVLSQPQGVMIEDLIIQSNHAYS